MSIFRIQRGRNHSYTINGHKAVGVTTALSKGLPKPNLIPWAAKAVATEASRIIAWPGQTEQWLIDNKLTDERQILDHLKRAPERIRDGAALRGSKVHKLAEKLVFTREDVDVPEELRGHVESVIKFFDEWKIRPLLVENTVGSYQWGYAGTFDLIAEVPDGRRILFDYKTGQSGIWGETALQLAAYRYADAYVAQDGTEIPMREVGVTEAKAVWVRADGYDVYPLNTDGHVFKVFLHVLQVAKNADQIPTWKGDAETPPWMKTY